jgi:hypothetical protein
MGRSVVGRSVAFCSHLLTSYPLLVTLYRGTSTLCTSYPLPFTGTRVTSKGLQVTGTALGKKSTQTTLFGGLANAVNPPPEEYGRKAKTQRNRRGPIQVVEHVV